MTYLLVSQSASVRWGGFTNISNVIFSDFAQSTPMKGTLTPLMRASAIGHVNAVRELLEDGVDINERGPRGSTALMFAAGGGHLEVVKELVIRGADVTATEEGGWTARRHAEEDNDHEVATFLAHIESTPLTPPYTHFD